MKKFLQIIDKISIIGAGIAAASICIALLLILTEIFFRGALHRSIYIAGEYVGYLMGMISFLGFSYCLLQDAHVRVAFFKKIKNEKTKLIIDMTCYLTGIAFAFLLTCSTFNYFMSSLINGTRSMSIAETPLAIPQFFIFLGSLLLLLQFIAKFFKIYLAFKGNINT